MAYMLAMLPLKSSVAIAMLTAEWLLGSLALLAVSRAFTVLLLV